jgi:hypothetical protein
LDDKCNELIILSPLPLSLSLSSLPPVTILSFIFISSKLSDTRREASPKHKTMASLEDKLNQLEEATSKSQALFFQHEAKLKSATDALEAAKSKLRALSPDAQANLQVNDTDLPELLNAKILAQDECEASKKRYEVNQKYLMVMKAKAAKKS